MKNKLLSLGGIILFYSVIIFGVLLLNMRFSYLNENSKSDSYIAMNN